MAIINSYTRDTDIKNSDVFIGTKFSNRQTVNFTAQTVADYLNINGKISIAGQMLWKFVVINPGNGTMSFEGGGGEGEPFEDITELILSKTDGSGQFVNIFLDYLIDTQILLSQQSTINQFGHYKIVSYAVQPDPNFYKLTLEFIGGNGGLIKDAYYDMASFFIAAEVIVPNLQEVTDAGSITGNNIELIEEAELRFENIGINKRLSGASILSLTGIQIFNLPDVGGIIPISVNGQIADANGNITLPDTTIPTLQTVTDAGASTTNKITVNVSNNLPAIIASNTTGLGLFASSDDFVVGRFNLDTASNNSNIVEFLKNNVLQSYITHNGTIVGNKSLINTTVDNGVDALQINGSLIATSIKKTGGLSTQFLKADGSIDSNTYLTSASSYWTKVGNNIVKNNTGNVYFAGDGTDNVPHARYDSTLNSITGSFSNGDFNNNSIGIQQVTDGITMFINNSDGLRGWLQTGRSLTLNTTYSTGFIDFMVNSVSKLKLNNNGTLKYATDVSSLYDARTLIDKGYADATYLTSSSNYWTKTGDNIQNNNIGNIIMKINNDKKVSFTNLSDVETSKIDELGNIKGKSFSLLNSGSGMFPVSGADFLEFRSNNGNVSTPAFSFKPDYLLLAATGLNVTILQTGGNYNPSTSSQNGFIQFEFNPIINQTGTANQIVRSIYINPTLTSAIDFRAIEVTAGKSIFQELNATSFIKTGGTSSQILAADGSVITAGTNITISGGTISSVGGSGGGGSSVNYYLNGGTSQGTFGGTTYYEFSRTAVIGTGVDFSIGTNGYIASFITDVADPSLLLIPAGNWNLEFFFSSSSAGGSPSFYTELYKYDGTTFTLVASSSVVPEGITGGTSIDAYFTSLAVPETTLTVNDRLAIRVFVNTSGKTITLHTQDSHLCEVITTFTSGLTALNGLQAQVQNFAIGTTGTDFDIVSSGSTHTFNLPSASATARGVVTTGSQTFAGSKIFSSQTILGDGLTGTPTYGLLPQATVGSTTGGVFDIRNTNTNIVAGNTIGTLQFSAKDDESVAYSTAQIKAITQNGIGTGSSGKTDLIFYTSNGSSSIERVKMNDLGLIINSEVTSTIASFDSNKSIKSLTTTDGYPSLVELKYVKGVTSAIQTQLNYDASATQRGAVTTGVQTFAGAKTFSSVVTIPNGVNATEAVNKGQLDLKANANEVVKPIVNEFPNSTVNGTTSDTLLSTFTIPAGTLPTSCMPDIRMKFSKSGDGGTAQMRLRINTVNNFATSTQIATYIAVTNTDTFLVSRNPVISGGNMNIFISSASAQSDISTTAITESNFTIDVANTIYLFVSVTQGAAGDTTTLRAFKIIN